MTILPRISPQNSRSHVTSAYQKLPPRRPLTSANCLGSFSCFHRLLSSSFFLPSKPEISYTTPHQWTCIILGRARPFCQSSSFLAESIVVVSLLASLFLFLPLSSLLFSLLPKKFFKISDLVSGPSSQWCHPTVSSSVFPFSSCLQSFPASGSFPMSWLFTSGGQSIGASASVLPVNIQNWFLLGLTGLTLQSEGTLKSLIQHHSSKPLILQCLAFFMVHVSHPYMTTGKTIQTYVGKVMSLLFNMLSGFVVAFLPRSIF